MARTHYENFAVASVLLPRRLVPHFHAVYAFCRWADDLADETAGGTEALTLFDWWRRELLAVYAGEPRHPVTGALRALDGVARVQEAKGKLARILVRD